MADNNPEILNRAARISDTDGIAAFNAAMALETENRILPPEIITAGVHNFLEHPEWGFLYRRESGGQVVACLMITTNGATGATGFSGGFRVFTCVRSSGAWAFTGKCMRISTGPPAQTARSADCGCTSIAIITEPDNLFQPGHVQNPLSDIRDYCIRQDSVN
jgi:hypothetical protein